MRVSLLTLICITRPQWVKKMHEQGHDDVNCCKNQQKKCHTENIHWQDQNVWKEYMSWYRVGHFRMTSSHGNIFRITGHLCEEFTSHQWISLKKTNDVELWCFFYLRLNKWLSKQQWGWWFETPSCSLWCHRNVLSFIYDQLDYLTSNYI